MSFRDITGHRALLRLVSRAVAKDSLPPSLIFSGLEGIGKRCVAVAIAKALNCQNPFRFGVHSDASETTNDMYSRSSVDGKEFDLDACGRCDPCRRIALGFHADVLMIEPGETGSIKIDQVRDVIERSAYRPFEGRVRVVIFDNADTLVVGAQNALLKILEEPPSASLFFLISDRPGLLLPTVRSRCPRLRFGCLTASEVAQLLITRGYDQADAHAAAATADGSFGRVLDKESSEFVSAREAASRVLHTVSGEPDSRQRLDGAKQFMAGKTVKRSQLGVDRESLALRLRALGSLLRDLELLSTHSDENLLVNADLKPTLYNLTKAFNSDRIVRAFSSVDRALIALIERNASPKIVADWVIFQI